MIAEELVASGGAQAHEANASVEHPQAAVGSKLRVSVSIHMAVRALVCCARTQKVPYVNSGDAHV